MFYYWLATLGQRSPFTFYTSSSVIMAGVAKTFFDFALSDLAGSAHAFSQYAGKVGCDAAIMSSLAVCPHAHLPVFGLQVVLVVNVASK